MAFNPLLITVIAIGATLVYASILDLRERRVPFRTWYPMVAIGVPCTALFYASIFSVDPAFSGKILAVSAVFAACFYLFGIFGLIGGADAWALILITLLVPVFPFTPFLGGGILGIFSLPLLINAGIVALLAPIGIFLRNRARHVRGPLLARFRGYPVTFDEITKGRAFGFLMEELNEKEGRIQRRYYSFGESLRAMLSGTRLYTRELRVKPDAFPEELALIERASPVWISYGVPFIVPITIGFVWTLILGDTLSSLISTLLGV
jgi:preflagellin peptidase FlaK